MNSEQLLRAMGEIDDELLGKSENDAGSIGDVGEEGSSKALLDTGKKFGKKNKRGRKRWLWGTTVAASLALAAGIGGKLFLNTSFDIEKLNSPRDASLPVLTLGDGNQSDAMGFEGMMAYDISELVNGNPWTEDMEIETLPVYKNNAYQDDSGLPGQIVSETDMHRMAEETAEKLGLEVEEIITQYMEEVVGFDEEADENKIYKITAKTRQAEITVACDGHIRIEFLGDGVALPEEYNFNELTTSREEAEETVAFFMQKYSDLFGMENPKPDVYMDRNIYGDQNIWYHAYDAVSDTTERILNYNFNKITFAANEKGNLWLIYMDNQLEGREKLGEYPIITAEEAQKLLLNGNYVTSVPEKLPGKKYIKKVELVYKTDNRVKVYVPYYRFWVDLPDEMTEGLPEGLHTYGAYYVPAVEPQYIADMPVWDGSFN